MLDALLEARNAHVPFFFQAEDGIRDRNVTGLQTCALPILNFGLILPPLFHFPLYTNQLNHINTHSFLHRLLTHSNLHLVSKANQKNSNNYQFQVQDNQIGRASCREREKISMVVRYVQDMTE